MKKREALTVVRPGILDCYKKNMVSFLMTSKGMDQDTAMRLVDKSVTERLTDPTIIAIDTTSPGNTVTKRRKLSSYIKSISDKIVTPSGSIYTPSTKKTSFISKMITDGLNKRKKLKKKMNDAFAVGDTELGMRYHYAQSSVKINLNSLPGGFGSAYNVFYDKGGYNAITSSARSLIAHAYTIGEIFLGSNWAWYNEEELINHVITVTNKCPDEASIIAAMTEYKLKYISTEELYTYLVSIVNKYRPKDTCATVRQMLDRLLPHQLQFLFYCNNLRNLFWHNEEIYLPYVKDLIQLDISGWEDKNPEDMWDMDSDLIIFVFNLLKGELVGIKHDDIVSKHPDVAKRCTAVGHNLQVKLDRLDNLFNTFIFTEVELAGIPTRKAMFRNTVVLSDTDSVIYTVERWAHWIVGQTESLEGDAFNSAALVTYWLTKVVADTLAKFSIAQGATGVNVNTMQMKNEFLYPSMLIYNVKKVYAGYITMQEGVVLTKDKVDLKGGALRSSNIPVEAREFNKDLIVEKILKPSVKGRISAVELIAHVTAFETKMIESMSRGEVAYITRSSIGPASDYKLPKSSVWSYADFWNDVFGPKYGVIKLPDKLPCVKLRKPTQQYFDQLKLSDPELHNRMLAKIEATKFPTALAIPSIASEIPPEVIPLIDYKHIVFTNLKPTYMTLERLNITTGYEHRKVLLSDVYT